MEKVRLGDVCSKDSSNIAQKDLDNNDGTFPIYGASGFIKNVDFYKQEKEYIAVVKDGAGVGRVMKCPAKSSVIGTMQYILPKENINIDFLAFAMENMNLAKYYTGATIPHIYFKDYCKEMVLLPSLDEQKQITRILNKIVYVIDKRKKQLSKLDELVKARFVELFGDPVVNEKGWDTKPLLEMGSCKNGMNFHYEDTGVEINCLGVGDFKDYSIISDTSILPTVSLNEMPSADYMLQDDDIVFVRSNGNKALVGRSIAVYPGDIPTTFSGFCIRYRKTDKAVSIPYLLRVLKTESVRQKMSGRGANIQNLNQQILGTLIIPVPPMELQNQFAAFVEQTDKSKMEVQKSLEKLDLLKNALMQKYLG